MARFDRRLISQAVTNILKNATEGIAAVPAGERGQGIVSLDAYEEAERVVVDVTDNGIGFPAEKRNRLLEPYMTTREGGTGLGLPIVGKILEDHGGGIELLDSPAVAAGGRGARVRLWFPRQEKQSEKQGEKPGGIAAEAGRDKHGRTISMSSDILIIDDEADIRDLVAGILEDEGYKTRKAGGSDEALAEIAKRRPQMIFLDIWLQGSKLDGLQLLDIIHADHPMCRW